MAKHYTNEQYRDPNYLFQAYIVDRKSVEQIAKETNTSPGAVKWQLYTQRIVRGPNDDTISRDILESLYVGTPHSIKAVADMLGTYEARVSEYLDLYGIEKIDKRPSQYDATHDQEWIDLYTNKHMSLLKIAQMYGTADNAVKRHLLRNGIELRSRSTAQRVLNYNFFIHPDLSNKDILIDLHHGYHYSIGVIADMYRCDIGVVKGIFNRLAIPIYSQRTKDQAPPATHFDHQFETSLLTRARSYCMLYFNPVVLERDKYSCRLCGSNTNLEVHHDIFTLATIVYTCADMYSMYSIADNISELFEILKTFPWFTDLDNLVTLCSGCHHKVHQYRKMQPVNQQPTCN